MKKLDRRTILRIAAIPIVIFVLIQLLPVDRSNPPVVSEIDAPAEVLEILKQSCFDCHSNHTEWPWYSRVAPVSWVVSNHVVEGREHLNFSVWPSNNPTAQGHLLHEISEEVSSGEMPESTYLWMHDEARLSESQKSRLLAWAHGGEG